MCGEETQRDHNESRKEKTTRGMRAKHHKDTDTLMTANGCAAHGTTSSTTVHRRACVRAGKRTAVCPTADRQLVVHVRRERRQLDRIERGSIARGAARVVPLSVAALSVAPVSVVRAGEHDAKRCRRA